MKEQSADHVILMQPVFGTVQLQIPVLFVQLFTTEVYEMGNIPGCEVSSFYCGPWSQLEILVIFLY